MNMSSNSRTFLWVRRSFFLYGIRSAASSAVSTAGRGKTCPHNAPWTPGEEIAFRRFGSPNELALALSADDQELQAAAVDAIRVVSHLRSPQWSWFKKETYFLSRRSDIVFIGFQETLNEDFALLKKILNLPEHVRLPEDEVASHKNAAHVDRRLDEQAMRNLKIWYARDYQFLELCRELAAELRSGLDKSAIEHTSPRS